MVPPKLYKIGEVMRYSGLSRQTVHNYTVMGLIAEAERTPSGHRLYGGEVFERLARIRELKEGLTLQAIKRLLDDEDAPVRVASGRPELDGRRANLAKHGRRSAASPRAARPSQPELLRRSGQGARNEVP